MSTTSTVTNQSRIPPTNGWYRPKFQNFWSFQPIFKGINDKKQQSQNDEGYPNQTVQYINVEYQYYTEYDHSHPENPQGSPTASQNRNFSIYISYETKSSRSIIEKYSPHSIYHSDAVIKTA